MQYLTIFKVHNMKNKFVNVSSNLLILEIIVYFYCQKGIYLTFPEFSMPEFFHV